MGETGWTKEFPTVSGIYWARWPSSVSVNTFIVEVIGRKFYMTGRSLICPNSETPYPDEWLGPISPADFEQLIRLRTVAAQTVIALDATVVDEPKSTNGLAFQQYEHFDVQLKSLRNAANALRGALAQQEQGEKL